MSALGKGPGGGGGRGGGGFRGGGGQRGGGMRMGGGGGGFRGRHGGGHHGGRGWRRGGWGGRGWGRGWWGGWSPGFVEYYSYSPCDECWGQPPALYLNCLRYYGCPVPGSALYGLGQETSAPSAVSIPAAVGVFAVWGGLMWWLNSRRKKGS